MSSNDVTTNGNVYASMTVGVEGALPKEVADVLEITGTVTAMLQFGDGNMATEVANVAKATSPLDFLKTISSAALMGKFNIGIAIKLEDLTNGYNLTLSDLSHDIW